MPAIEPFAPRRQDEPPPRGVRWRYALAAVITVILMIAVFLLLVWIPII
jgi:hypothetical protein